MSDLQFPAVSIVQRLDALDPAGDGRSPRPMVLDTDTYNEVDDQFAIAHALLSPEAVQVEALYAAPFHNTRSSGPADGMERSYDEIHRVLRRLPDVDAPPVYRGSPRFLASDLIPVESPAVADLIARSAAAENGRLTVVAIGAITNIASALLIEPQLVDRIRVIWLGGNALHWPHAREFNLRQDVPAARVLLDSGVPLTMLPAMGVVSHLHTTVPELERYVAGRSGIGDYLTEIVKGYHDDHEGWSKVIWDIAGIAYLINPAWTPSILTSTPLISDQMTWSVDQRRHLMRYVYHVDRDAIFRDLFAKLAGAG